MWRLVHNGAEIERHPHKITCVIAAIERGLAYWCRGRDYLIDAVKIERVK